METVNVAIIGAGPAGMAAAATLAEAGVSCVVLDEQPAAGGQIYRAIQRTENQRGARSQILGKDYQAGAQWVERLQHAGIRTQFGVTVWQIDSDGTLSYSAAGQVQQRRATHILLATGAQERPYAFRGWTVPGVMSAGAAQILLKAHGVVPQGAVLAGNGPLLYLLAMQLIQAGFPPAMILETVADGALTQAMPHLPAALLGGKRYLWKGLKMLAAIRLARIPHYRGISQLTAHPDRDGQLCSVSFQYRGHAKTVTTEHLLVHQGVIPNTQFSRALGVVHDWSALQQCWQPRTDRWGDLGQQRFVAGDGAGIGGAVAAALAGQLSALQIAHQQGAYTVAQRDARAKPLFRQLAQEQQVRPFLDALYAPDYRDVLTDDQVMVCRCEEVTSGMLRAYVRQGCLGLNQTKVFSRCGMGPCQGRMCGLTAAQVLADERQVAISAVDYYRIRMPIKSVTLRELASLAE